MSVLVVGSFIVDCVATCKRAPEAGETVVGDSYNNVKFALGNAAEGTNYVYLKATNNGSVAVNIRVDVMGNPTVVIANATSICNRSATMNGETVTTDLEWGGSLFYGIAPGSTAELIVYFEGYAGELQLMFDSFTYQDKNTYNGDVTISDIKFAVFGKIDLQLFCRFDAHILFRLGARHSHWCCFDANYATNHSRSLVYNNLCNVTFKRKIRKNFKWCRCKYC